MWSVGRVVSSMGVLVLGAHLITSSARAADASAEATPPATTAPAAPTAAPATALRNILRAGVFHCDPQGGTGSGNLPEINEYESGTGYRLSFERKLGGLVGLDFKFTDVTQDAPAHDFGEDFTEEITARTAGVDLLFHPGHAGRHVDYYLGFGVAYVFFDDRTIGLDDVGAPVLRTGMDIRFGETRRWGINLDLQKMWTNVFSSPDSNNYSPLHYGAALTLSF